MPCRIVSKQANQVHPISSRQRMNRSGQIEYMVSDIVLFFRCISPVRPWPLPRCGGGLPYTKIVQQIGIICCNVPRHLLDFATSDFAMFACLSHRSHTAVDGSPLDTPTPDSHTVPTRRSVCDSHYHFFCRFRYRKSAFSSQKSVFSFEKLHFSAEFSKFCKILECFKIEILKDKVSRRLQKL